MLVGQGCLKKLSDKLIKVPSEQRSSMERLELREPLDGIVLEDEANLVRKRVEELGKKASAKSTLSIVSQVFLFKGKADPANKYYKQAVIAEKTSPPYRLEGLADVKGFTSVFKIADLPSELPYEFIIVYTNRFNIDDYEKIAKVAYYYKSRDIQKVLNELVNKYGKFDFVDTAYDEGYYQARFDLDSLHHDFVKLSMEKLQLVMIMEAI